jgi:uncharacterized membrane protein (DUF106 family)
VRFAARGRGERLKPLIYTLVVWVPLFFWLAWEIHLLQAALATPCGIAGGDRHEVFLVLAITALPGSLLPDLLSLLTFAWKWLDVDVCTTFGCIATWSMYCAIVLAQWYFFLRAIAKKLARDGLRP